ncbi:MAG TPA: ATP-binding protein [Polyangiaceae bacterium]
MEELLSLFDTWIGGDDAIPVIDAASVSLVRERVREEGARAGLDRVRTESLVNVASELAQNQLVHGGGRRAVVVRPIARQGQKGVEVVAADEGEGIADVARALDAHPKGQGSLGVGLAAAHELADELDFDVRCGEGTCVRARKFDSYTTRGRRVGVYGRPHPGEKASGDDAAFARGAGGILFIVADGLGHGDLARQASSRAVNLLPQHLEKPLHELMADAHTELQESRGAVMIAGRVGADQVELAGVGNITAHAYGSQKARRFTGTSFFLGARGEHRRAATESLQIGPRDVLVVHSDGIRSGLDLSHEPDLLREHPIVVAQRVVERFGRPDDDAIVMVIG